MDKNQTCQLYKYQNDFYLATTDSPAYFAQEFHLDQLDHDYISWLNFHDLKDRDSVSRLCQNLAIDPLTIEDIFTEKRRPKLEEYKNYMFFSVRSALPNKEDTSILHQEQISFVLGMNYLVSFQEKSSMHFGDVRDRIEKKRGKIRSKGADFLLFRMLDAILDNYFEVLESSTLSIEALEHRIQHSKTSNVLKVIETEKRKLIELRKIVLPLKDVTFQLDKLDNPFLDASNQHHFSELKENCYEVLEEIDANKQILDGMANLYYAVQGQRMNEIMKILTIVSSIFIPLTFIVGVYGMNFKFMPELNYEYGYYTVVGVLFAIAFTLLFYFYKKGWLKK
ncbi:MAG: magnesium/cobalt transporter CorA [Crocinitomicaceae bacterium]|nr:magnesium/cobalt transporter CorA [Crocinitomicaceae bacterium]